MKINADCSPHKTDKDGKCYCVKLNRKFPREMRLYKQFMKNLDNKGKK